MHTHILHARNIQILYLVASGYAYFNLDACQTNALNITSAMKPTIMMSIETPPSSSTHTISVYVYLAYFVTAPLNIGDVTCDSPSVERGDPGHVTCNFNVDVSTQKRPISVKVVLYKIDNSDGEYDNDGSGNVVVVVVVVAVVVIVVFCLFFQLLILVLWHCLSHNYF